MSKRKQRAPEFKAKVGVPPTEVVHPQGYAYPVFRRARGWLASERSPKISY